VRESAQLREETQLGFEIRVDAMRVTRCGGVCCAHEREVGACVDVLEARWRLLNQPSMYVCRRLNLGHICKRNGDNPWSN
jgi:hypothetical protein